MYTVDADGWVIPEGGAAHARKIRVVMNSGGSYLLGCCGVVGLEGFNYLPRFADWKDKAELLACLYKQLYRHGTVIYAITQTQLHLPMHQLLLELGSQQITEFPNLAHGPNMIHMFKVNIRNVAGRYCNKYGDAYAEPPKDDSDIIPEQTKAQPTGWQEIPRR